MKKKNKDTVVYYTGPRTFEKENCLLMLSAKYYACNLKELKKDIQCPALGYDHYGKLGALGKRAVFIINELIEKIEDQDKIIRELYYKNAQKDIDYTPIIQYKAHLGTDKNGHIVWKLDDEDSEEPINK